MKTAKSMSVRVLAVALLAMMSVLVAACGTGVSGDPLDMVPARANVVGSVDLPTILSDPDVEEFYSIIAQAQDDPETPQTLEDLLAYAEEKTGLDLTTMGEAIVFGEVSNFGDIGALGTDGSEAEQAQYFGFIASGAPDGLFDKIRESAPDEFNEVDYKGVTILEGKSDEMAVAIVSDAAVIGTPDAVRGVIDVDQDDAPAFSGDLLTFYDSLGDVWGKVVITIPEQAKQELDNMSSEEMGLPVDLGTLLDVEAVGVSGTKAGSDGVLSVVLRYATEEQANEAKSTIDGLLSLAKMFGGDDPSLDVLDKIDISVQGTDLTLEIKEDIEAAKEQLRQMVDMSGGMMGF